MATYRIKTLGIMTGFQRERVEARLMLLFRRPLEAVRPIVEGNGALLKKGVDLLTAERYREALARCGCHSEIEEEEAPHARATLADYAALLQAQLEALDAGRRWQFIEADAELFGVPGPDSPYPLELVVPLERLYQEWLAAAPAASEELLRHAAGMALMGNTPGMVGEVTRHLLPIVRNSAERGQAMLAAARGYSPLLFRPLCEGLEVGLAYHRGKVVHRVAQAHLQAWELSEDQAYEAAYANLRARSATPLMATAQGVFGGAWNDGYDSSRLLLPDLLQQAVGKGRVVAMVPTRGLLMACSEHADSALDAMLKASIDAMREEKVITVRMLRLVDGQWQPFVPAAHARRLNSLAKYTEGNDYKLQRELLKRRMRAEGRQVYVATYLVGKTGIEQLRTSACTWTRGTASLLPRTDLLCFADPGGHEASVTVAWEAALPVVGALMQQTDDVPPRYFVDGFPNEWQMDQLRDIAAAARRELKAQLRAQGRLPPEPAPAPPARPLWQSLRGLLGRWLDSKPARAR